MPPNSYQRLPGSGRRRSGCVTLTATRNRLWLGEDHLLSVDLGGVTERYKRFDYRDIQAIIVRRTEHGRITNGALAIVLLLGGALLVSDPQVQGPGMIGAILSGCALLALLVNVLRGPTCTFHIVTAVQSEELPALHRLANARIAANRLRQRISAAQERRTGHDREGEVPVEPGEDAPPAEPAPDTLP